MKNFTNKLFKKITNLDSSKIFLGIIFICLILLATQNFYLYNKYQNSLKVGAVCEIKAYENNIDTQHNINKKEKLSTFEKDFKEDLQDKIIKEMGKVE